MANKKNISVCFTTEQFEKYADGKSTVVVVDLLRATSVISTAFECGVSTIIPVRTSEEARKYKDVENHIIAAERNTLPIEAGLGWITKFTKDFVDAKLLKVQKEGGATRKLVGLELIDKGIARKDYPIVDADGNKIGIVTSGTMSPTLNIAIAMGYVPKAFSKIDTEVFIQVRNKQLKARVVAFPFVK